MQIDTINDYHQNESKVQVYFCITVNKQAIFCQYESNQTKNV